MNKYRPDKFDAAFIASETLKQRGIENPVYWHSSVMCALVEAGADAMLDALKATEVPIDVYADALRYGLERCTSIIGGHKDDITYKGRKGKLIFIPDDPVEKDTGCIISYPKDPIAEMLDLNMFLLAQSPEIHPASKVIESEKPTFARYDIKFVKNRIYDFYDSGWYGIGNYLYNVPPKPSKEVIEEGYFCPVCGVKADRENFHICYQCLSWGIRY